MCPGGVASANSTSTTAAFAFVFLARVGSKDTGELKRLGNSSELYPETVLAHYACQRIVNAYLVLKCGPEAGVTGRIPVPGHFE